LGAVAQPLTNVDAPVGASEGQTQAVVAETSFTPAAPWSLDQLLADQYAIDVHLSTEEDGPSIVCGEIGGVRGPDGSLAIGLRKHDELGFTGIAFLAPSLTGDVETTDVTLFVAEDLA